MSATQEVEFLIVGGGMAGGHCAAELRAKGADESILLCGREPEPPYERPPLSKEYLRGESKREDAFVHPVDWYEENDVELRTKTSVTSIDPGERIAKLQGGDEVKFSKALLGTGAMVNLLRVDGAQLEGVHYLRAFGNADSIREACAEAKRVVMIGGSYIGSEVAASLRSLGAEVEIVMLEDVALSNTFGEEPGRFFHDVLSEHGVALSGGKSLASFEGKDKVEAVETEDGTRIECDAVVVGVGVRPDVMLAEKSGIKTDDGIVCDAKLETSAEGIFAAGDCCSYESELDGRRLRIEHWDVAMQQGRAAARNMLGADESYKVVPYFFSDLSDWASLEYVGHATDWDEIVWRGERDSGEFSAWYLKDGKLAAALSVERSDDLQKARELIESGADVSAAKDKLGDLDSNLEEI